MGALCCSHQTQGWMNTALSAPTLPWWPRDQRPALGAGGASEQQWLLWGLLTLEWHLDTPSSPSFVSGPGVMQKGNGQWQALSDPSVSGLNWLQPRREAQGWPQDKVSSWG